MHLVKAATKEITPNVWMPRAVEYIFYLPLFDLKFLWFKLSIMEVTFLATYNWPVRATIVLESRLKPITISVNIHFSPLVKHI